MLHTGFQLNPSCIFYDKGSEKFTMFFRLFIHDFILSMMSTLHNEILQGAFGLEFQQKYKENPNKYCITAKSTNQKIIDIEIRFTCDMDSISSFHSNQYYFAIQIEKYSNSTYEENYFLWHYVYPIELDVKSGTLPKLLEYVGMESPVELAQLLLLEYPELTDDNATVEFFHALLLPSMCRVESK